jgi:transposase
MTEDNAAATLRVCTLRVTLAELERIRAEDAARSSARSSSQQSGAFPAATALPTVECSAPALPHGPCPVCPRLAVEFEPWRQAGYWKALHQRAKERERVLQQENQQLQARIRYLEQQLYGKKAESAQAPAPSAASSAPTAQAGPSVPPRKRGQQRGRPGPRRRDHAHLLAKEEPCDLPENEKQCPHCGLPFEPFPGTEDSTVLEIEVQAYRRIIRRQRYRPRCSCPHNPGIITAPAPAKLIPKSIFGVSIWVELLLDKYLFYRPTYRLLAALHTHGLDLSQGSLTDGLQRLTPLFEPIYQKLVERSQTQPLWHADETRWLVFVTCEGKVGYRWYLWVFHAEEVVVFLLAMGRAHDVPEKHLGPVESGILVVDRYKAYQAIDKVKAGLIVLAFCWAHQRRDFLDVAKSWPQLEEWGLGWVARIGELYQLNDKRVEVIDQPAAFAPADQRVREAVKKMQEEAQNELADLQLHPAKQAVLESMGNHWTGLTVFVEHPEVPMDNNTAERAHRGPVVGRKNYYGSGSLWSGQLAAMLFSLFQTLALWNINPRVWLMEYLQACARAGGQAPKDVAPFMPWNMPEQQRKEWSLEKEREREREDSS